MHRSDTSRRDALLQLAGLTASFFTAGSAWADNLPADNPQNCAPPKPTAPARPFVGGQIAVKPRKSAFALTDAEIASLTRGWQNLKALSQQSPDNPIGWLRQSYVHCWACGGGTDGQQGEEIHDSWWFLPWHRAYLFFVERALVKASGDPDLRLPYWDWSTQGAATQTFPQIYANPASALYNPLRDAAHVRPGAQMPLEAVGPRAMYLVLGAPTFALFGGDNPAGPNGGSPGQLERIPHNKVHVWTGTDQDLAPNYGSDMGVLATAARDPVFFCHHANVDRMWPSWLATSPRNANPTDASWLGHSWSFYDENGVWTSIKVQDVLKSEALGYAYDSLAKAPPIGRLRTRAAVAESSAPKAAATAAAPAPRPLVLATPQQRVLRTAPVTHSVSIPPTLRQPLRALAENASPRLYVLNINDVSSAPNRSVSAKVFVNLPNANAATSTETPQFVGFISRVAKARGEASGHAHHGGVRYSFPIDEDLASILQDAPSITVTIVPADTDGAAPRQSEIRYGSITVTPLQGN
ncbi:tyrosinase family protein [Acidovorax sp. GBBC 3334]|uniref:tyrosinase family protein n=1 Tax=Acidovorax sp. GBBC 3334 TaxID=2940496 RepID=UPI00230390A1|nr:tyrosinase family protein [Acidovorax sp. GBBC 3334]MDA8454227.1 tyrosinase family protein [Acidovorax sp. GBBC 3334]